MRRTLRGLSLAPLLMLTTVWVLLMGEVTVGNIVAGLLVAFFVQVTFPLPSVTLTAIEPAAPSSVKRLS